MSNILTTSYSDNLFNARFAGLFSETPPSSATICWMVSAFVNGVYQSNISAVADMWYAQQHEDYQTNVNVDGLTWKPVIQLSNLSSNNDTIYKSIQPRLWPGSITPKIYVTSVPIDPSIGTTRVLDVVPVEDETSTVSATLTGGYNFGYGISGDELSGVLVYDTGKIELDFTHIDASHQMYLTGLPLLIRYQSNSPKTNPFSTPVLYLTSNMIFIQPKTQDVSDVSFEVMCSSTDPSVKHGYSAKYYPKKLNISESSYNYSSVLLNCDTNAQTKIKWEIENDGNLVVIFPNTETMSALTLTPETSAFEVDAITGGFICLSSDSQNALSSMISVQYRGYGTYQTNVTSRGDLSASYIFNYRPVTDETLMAATVQEDESSEIIYIYRQFTFPDGTIETSTVNGTIIWSQMTNYVNEIITTYDFYDGFTAGASSNDLSLTGFTDLRVGDVDGTVVEYKGLDYIGINALANHDYHFSIIATDITNTRTLSTTHVFQSYRTCNEVVIQDIELDNRFHTRKLTAKARSKLPDGVLESIHPKNSVRWRVGTDSPYITWELYTSNGLPYTGENTDDTIIVHLSAEKPYPSEYVTFTLNANVYDTRLGVVEGTLIATGRQSYTVDTFPDDPLNLVFSVDGNSTDIVTDIYVLTGSQELGFVDYTQIVGDYITVSSKVWDFGDGERELVWAVSGHEYDISASSILTAKLIYQNVSTDGFLMYHDFEKEFRIHFISQFLSANFIAFPKYVFSGNTVVSNDITNPETLIISAGNSSWAHGHTETFYFSALTADDPDVQYNWYLDGQKLPNPLNSHIYEYVTQTPIINGVIKLELSNNELPVGMPETRLSDNALVSYANIAKSGGTNAKHLNMLEYSTPRLDIYYGPSAIAAVPGYPITIDANYTLTKTDQVSYISSRRLNGYWQVSSRNWVIKDHDAILQYDLSLGDDDTIPGIIAYGADYEIVITRYQEVMTYIDNSNIPYDWGASFHTIVSSVKIPIYSIPELVFVPKSYYALTGEDIEVLNSTTSSDLVTSFAVENGEGHTQILTGYEDFTFPPYTHIGSFAFSITGYISGGDTYTAVLSNSVEVIDGWTEYDPDIKRVFNETELVFPYSASQIRIPPNEWATSETVNAALDRLNSNLEYMINMTKFYRMPPLAYIGWMGSYRYGNTIEFGWQHVNQSLYEPLENSILDDNHFIDVQSIVSKNGLLYITNDKYIEIYDTRRKPRLLVTIDFNAVDEKFVSSHRLAVNEEGWIFALDRDNNRIIVFNGKSGEYMFEWGGYGGPRAKHKFRNPNDVYISSDNTVWVTDTTNKVLKQYSKGGSYVNTVYMTDYVGDTIETGGLIGMTIDDDGIIHALTKSMVHRVQQDGTYLGSYGIGLEGDGTPHQIITMFDKGFVYICYSDHILKRHKNGSVAGAFAYDLDGSDFRGIYHDDKHMFYIANKQNILKYADTHVITQTLDQSIYDYFWSMDDIHIKSNEMIQDWVLNIAFKRLYDNIEIFKRSIYGQVVYQELSPYQQIVATRDYTPTEVANMTLVNKSDIYIGLNELVSSDVINRCLDHLHRCMVILLPYI